MLAVVWSHSASRPPCSRWDPTDVSTRGNSGWRQTLGTLKDGTIEFEMVWDPGDAGFTAIKDAWLNDYAIGDLNAEHIITQDLAQLSASFVSSLSLDEPRVSAVDTAR